MALSNSTSFTMNAGQIILEAFKRINEKSQEQPLQATEMQDGLNTLNLLMKAWQAQGLHLWSMEEAILFLDVGKTSYLVGPTGAPCCSFDDFIGTKLSVDALSGDTVFTVNDTTGMQAADHVGIQLNDNTRIWTTIVSVDSPTQITITDPITADSTSGNTVFTFTDYLNRPLRILSFRRNDYGFDNEFEVYAWSRNEYFNQPNKNSQGTPVNAYYSPQLGNGRIYVWQTSSSVNQFLRFTYEKPLDDITDQADDLEFPVEWNETIILNLALRLCPIYDVPLDKVNIVAQQAEQSLGALLGWDEEMDSINLAPYRS